MKITTAIKHISSPESEEMIRSFVHAHPQGVMTTITKGGRLQGSVINIFDLDNYQLAFMTRQDTRKVKNLHENPTVSFVTFDPFSRTEAVVEGVAYPIEDKEQQADILKLIDQSAKEGRWHIPPYVSKDDDYVLYIIYPQKIHMTTYWERESGVEAFHESLEFEVSKKS